MNSQGFYTIYIFLSANIGVVDAAGLEKALRTANLKTLCQQYGLDPSESEEILENLAIIGNPIDEIAPFFFVKYGLKAHQTLMINRWDMTESEGKILLEAVKASVETKTIQKRLAGTTRIFSIPLREPQLGDLGMLLAYEIARWGTFHGKGVVRGLDGEWYALNQHQAFVPLE